MTGSSRHRASQHSASRHSATARLVVLVTALASAAAAWNGSHGAALAQERGEAFVIRNATILTAGQGRIDGGSILVEGGRIAAIGATIEVPDGAVVIDGTDLYVTPGIIDAHSHLATLGGVNEGSISVSSMAGTASVLDPTDIGIYRALAGGVTTANILHGSANAIGGQNAVIKMRWGRDAAGLVFEGAPPGIKFALGENPKRSNVAQAPGADRRYPATRMGVMDVIHDAFVEAQTYRAAWERYEARVAAGETDALPPARDLKLEPLVEVLDGTRLVHAHCYRADEIVQLLRLAEELGFRIATLQHVLEGYKVADEIAAHGAGASTFSDWWAFKIEAFDATPYNAALMVERGVLVSINSDSAEEIRHLNQEAAKAMKYGGLSEEAALQLVTLNPARQLRIDDRVGSLEAGKDADLVLWQGHPLSVYAVAQQVFVDGELYFDREDDIGRRAALAREKAALIASEREAEPEERTPRREPTVETTPQVEEPHVDAPHVEEPLS